MKGPDSSRIGTNPCRRVGACLNAGAHIKLQHDRRLSIFGEDFYWTCAGNRGELGLMVVVADLQPRRSELLGCGVESISQPFPGIGSSLQVGACHDEVLATQ